MKSFFSRSSVFLCWLPRKLMLLIRGRSTTWITRSTVDSFSWRSTHASSKSPSANSFLMPCWTVSRLKREPGKTSKERMIRALSTPTLPTTVICPTRSSRAGAGASVVSGETGATTGGRSGAPVNPEGGGPCAAAGAARHATQTATKARTLRARGDRSRSRHRLHDRGELESVVLASDLDAGAGGKLSAQDELRKRVLEETL